MNLRCFFKCHYWSGNVNLSQISNLKYVCIARTLKVKQKNQIIDFNALLILWVSLNYISCFQDFLPANNVWMTKTNALAICVYSRETVWNFSVVLSQWNAVMATPHYFCWQNNSFHFPDAIAVTTFVVDVFEQLSLCIFWHII